LRPALLLLVVLLGGAAPGPQARLREYIAAIEPRLRHHPQQLQDYAKLVYWTARRHRVEPELLAAIVRRESDFEPEARSCYIVHRQRACWVTCDHGFAQINDVWVQKLRLSTCRLDTDAEYNLDVAAGILQKLQRQYAQAEPETWVSRYNGGKEGPARERYQLAIEDLLEVGP
jgi:soluble lytic murein transglycosylase-like protein